MRHNRAQLALFVGLSAGLLLSGQQPSFRVFTTEDGLVRNWVTKIHRDSRGFLWFCTVEGISLFDGYRFTNFSNKDGLPSRLVVDMIETRRGEYWFATEAGLVRFHAPHESGPTFKVLRLGASEQSNDVHALLEGRDGTIWCATAGGLYRFQPETPTVRPSLIRLRTDLTPLDVLSLAEDSRRNLWLGTSRGLVRRRPTGEADFLHVNISEQRITAMLIDGHDRLWIGGLGLAGIDTSTEPPRALPPENIPKTTGWVLTLYEGEHGELWIASSTRLVRFHPDVAPRDLLVYAISDAFPTDRVGAIEQDAGRNVWLAVGSLGVVRISTGSSEFYTRASGLESVEVLGMVKSVRGSTYAITGRSTWFLNEFVGHRFVPIRLHAPMRLATWAVGPTIIQDRKGAWWAASGEGVIRYPSMNARNLQGRSPERVYSVRDGLPSGVILRMFEDSRGDMWAGTDDGLGCWSRATGRWRAFRTSDLIPGSVHTAAVHSFAEDRSGAVWVGMSPSGLVRFRGASFKLITHEVPGGGINSLLSDRQGRLWIGSSKDGVGRMDNPEVDEPRIERYSVDQGLSSGHVFSLAEDDLGRIYVANGRGVERLDPNTKTMYHFTASSDLPPGDTQFLFHDREGNIWFASFNGLVRYRPEPNQTWEAATPLIRGVTLGGEPYPIFETGEQVVTASDLAPGRDNLEVEFRALHFDTRDRLRYQYRLEGADADWSKPSEDQAVHYARLAPGRYRFTVRSIRESGQISPGQATLAFRVLPAFWRRSWFLGMVILIIVSGAVFLHRFRLNHLLALERVRTRLATDLHDDLGADLAEIAILSEVAKRQEHSRTMELLDGIAGRARSLREVMTDIVWTVDPREDSVAALVLRLRQVAFNLLESEERSVEFFAPSDELLGIELAPAVRRHVLLFFKEAVANVARHAGATAVRLEIGVVKRRFRISIRDNGCGFDQQQSFSGRGLRSLQYRAKELRGDCEVQSMPGHGTETVLSLLL